MRGFQRSASGRRAGAGQYDVAWIVRRIARGRRTTWTWTVDTGRDDVRQRVDRLESVAIDQISRLTFNGNGLSTLLRPAFD